MYAYEVSVPQIQLGISKLDLKSIDPLDSAQEFISVINNSVDKVNEMINTLNNELDESIRFEKLQAKMRENADKDSEADAINDIQALNGDLLNNVSALKSKEQRNIEQLENFGNVLNAINASHNVLNVAVTNTATRIDRLFAESEIIYKELAKLTTLISSLYNRIIEISAKLEIHYLAVFDSIRKSNDKSMTKLTEIIGAYYATSVIIVNKYSYEDEDIRATLKLDTMDITAYYKDLLNDVYASKDSFMDFSKAWTNTAGDSLDRFLNTDRQFNIKNFISVTTVSSLLGFALGYKFARKWR